MENVYPSAPPLSDTEIGTISNRKEEEEDVAIPVKFIPAPTLYHRIRAVDYSTWIYLLGLLFLFGDFIALVTVLTHWNRWCFLIVVIDTFLTGFLLYAVTTNDFWVYGANEVIAYVLVCLSTIACMLSWIIDIDGFIFYKLDEKALSENIEKFLPGVPVMKWLIFFTIFFTYYMTLCIIRHKLVRAVRRRIQHEMDDGQMQKRGQEQLP